jgi:hypothetical protein
VTSLDYEGTLRALQAFIGKRVLVSIFDRATAPLPIALLAGRLASGDIEDLAALTTDEKAADLAAGEVLTFTVGSRESALEGCVGAFLLPERGFLVGIHSTDEDGNESVTFAGDDWHTRIQSLSSELPL